MKFWIILFLIFGFIAHAEDAPEEKAEDIEPISPAFEKYLRQETRASVDKILNYHSFQAVSKTNDWVEGELVPIFSQQREAGVVAFVEVQEIRPRPDGLFDIILELRNQSTTGVVQIRDDVVRVDLSKATPLYRGSTSLLIKKARTEKTSARYKPLVYQGFAIGETAQTLGKSEAVVNFLGLAYYGVTDWWTIGALIPGYVLNNPNFLTRVRVHDSSNNAVSLGGSLVRVSQTSQTTLNLNILWDSVSSSSLIQHTFVSVGLVTWEGANDAAAIKALGSSSLQTGYEFILTNWNRVLLGPNYNFEKRAVGGYLAHMWVYDRLHFQLSVNTTNVARFKFDPTDGYYGGFDLFWRF